MSREMVKLRGTGALLRSGTPALAARTPEESDTHHNNSLSTPPQMDLNEVQNATVRFFTDANEQFNRIPGSAIAVRYIKSSYQDDPVRSAVELFLFLFAVRYLLAPKYSTQKKVQLSDAVHYTPGFVAGTEG
jgi:hypothetical protein